MTASVHKPPLWRCPRCGPVTVYAQKTRFVLQARVRFADGVARKRWFEAALWLKRRAGHPVLSRVEDLGRLGYAHHFRLAGARDLDAAFGRLVREAFAVGRQDPA